MFHLSTINIEMQMENFLAITQRRSNYFFHSTIQVNSGSVLMKFEQLHGTETINLMHCLS